MLVLYDVSSSYFEGRHVRWRIMATAAIIAWTAADRLWLARTREGLRRGEVFEGNTADPMTLRSQIRQAEIPLAIKRVVLVGDRA